MAVKRFQNLLKTRNFGFIIGFLFSVFFCLTGFSSGLFGDLEAKLLDTYFRLKALVHEMLSKKAYGKRMQMMPSLLISLFLV